MKQAYIDIPEGQVHYWTQGSGSPLLLLHQGPFSAEEFSLIIPILSRHYRCIARDMLGYGGSDINPPDFNIEDYARADISFMQALGIKKASILGVHTGASIATEMAATHPEMVDKLVFYGLPTLDPGVRTACISSYTYSPVEPKEDGSHLVTRLWKPVRKLGAKLSLERCHRIVAAAAIASGGAFHAEQAVFRYNEGERIPLIKSPVLLISGTGDVFHARLESTKRLIRQCETVVIQDADTFGTLEKPEEIAEAALEFLRA